MNVRTRNRHRFRDGVPRRFDVVGDRVGLPLGELPQLDGLVAVQPVDVLLVAHI
jgi:hypothetical protein